MVLTHLLLSVSVDHFWSSSLVIVLLVITFVRSVTHLLIIILIFIVIFSMFIFIIFNLFLCSSLLFSFSRRNKAMTAKRWPVPSRPKWTDTRCTVCWLICLAHGSASLEPDSVGYRNFSD